ncbi:hypothetical protein ACL6C3_18025 [Capilliphycus salinus ALCB114379]|uniref:hypothetical protein n=1 Tax=Capilliphycus salinus TaxID=2768948 RepID=UPI0039A44521
MNPTLISSSLCCLITAALSFGVAQSTQAQSNLETTNKHQSWCQSQGGNWVDNTCQWEQLQMKQSTEVKLSQECGQQNGIWHTLFEEVYNPKCSGACLAWIDPFDFEYIEKGVVCAWYSGIEPAQ